MRSPPFALLKTLDTGPITNHVNFARNANGTFAYVTVGGLNEVQGLPHRRLSQVATIPVGKLPHGVWPSGDGTRVYVGLENADALTAIDTLTNTVVATIPIGQAPQAIAYVPNAVPEGDGTENLQPLGVAGQAAHLVAGAGRRDGGGRRRRRPASSLFDQGLVQVLQASVTGLEPKQPYVLGLATSADGAGTSSRSPPSRPTRPARRSSTPSVRSARSCRARRARSAAISSSLRRREAGPAAPVQVQGP